MEGNITEVSVLQLLSTLDFTRESLTVPESLMKVTDVFVHQKQRNLSVVKVDYRIVGECPIYHVYAGVSPQFGVADVEIKVPTVEKNTKLKGSPFKGWSRLVYSHTYYAYCQEFPPC